MNALEKKILTVVANNLSTSTNAPWVEGTLDDWANYAKKMRQSIRDSVKLMEEMISHEDKNETDKNSNLTLT